MIEKILDRLDRVRQVSPGRWTAICPAHPDKTPSLHLREADGGKILIHCFAGCVPADILAAVGVNMADLFPSPAPGDRGARATWPAIDVLRAMAVEAEIICQASRELRDGFALTPDDHARLCVASERIQEAARLAGAHHGS